MSHCEASTVVFLPVKAVCFGVLKLASQIMVLTVNPQAHWLATCQAHVVGQWAYSGWFSFLNPKIVQKKKDLCYSVWPKISDWANKLTIKVFTEVRSDGCFPIYFYKPISLCATTDVSLCWTLKRMQVLGTSVLDCLFKPRSSFYQCYSSNME